MIRCSLNGRIRNSLLDTLSVLGDRQNASMFTEMRQVSTNVGVQFRTEFVTATTDRVRGRCAYEMIVTIVMVKMMCVILMTDGMMVKIVECLMKNWLKVFVMLVVIEFVMT